MFKKNNKAIAGAVVTALTLGAAATQAGERYIIQSADSQNAGMSAMQAAPVLKQVTALAGVNLKRDLLETNGFLAAELTPAAAKRLKDAGYVLQIDPRRELLAESTPYGITMTQANQVAEANGGSVKVCITDTGYDLGHEDLPSSSVTGDDNDGNGNDTGNWYNDGHGHGSHVSGTIAGIGGNNVGVVGVNPGNNISLHMVKLFNDAGSWAYGSDLVAAINQCVSSGAKVMSMSIGGPTFSSAEQSAFQTAYNNGMLLIAAAGNDGNSADSYPASYSSVMSVAAVDSNENRASYSQYPAAVEIAAPGSGVTSTIPGGYATWDGTSMATPHVAGVAALVWAHYPQCSNAQIRNAINMTAQDKGAAGRDQYYGYGIVKAKDMFDALATEGCDVTGGGGGTEPPVEPPAEDGVLANGVAQSVSGATGEEVRFTFEVPAGATDITVAMSGGSGDGDLYVKKGSAPTTSSYDCRPYKSGNNESCTGTGEGTYHVMVRGYSAFSGASLVGSFTAGGGGGGAVGGGSTITDISVSRRKWVRYTLEVPAGMATLDIDISGGSGDADLYVNYGSQSSTSSYDCRPYKSGNNEACSFTNPAAGTWHIDIRGYSSASGITLNAYYNP
jgi:serine protease